jgi:arylsulfatase
LRELLAMILALIGHLGGCSSQVDATARPNILLIVADDLGYTDIGPFGGEIETPNLDELAKAGVRLTSFYAAPTCSPARAMLLTGVDSHRAGLGTMAERRTEVHEGIPGYEGYISDKVLTIAEWLQQAGYRTYMTGKWHLGLTPETNPASRGFDRSFALLNGAAFHLSDKPYADPELTGKDKADYTEDGLAVELPADFYSTQFFAERLIQYIDEDRDQHEPFFAYLAFTAPHFPLQAPRSSIAKYAGHYDDGYEVAYANRLRRMVNLELVSTADEFPQPKWRANWASLSEDERKIEARRMETYAAMIGDMDRYIGRVIDYLKEIGEYERTLILFMSDNGVEGRNVAASIRSLGTWPDRCCAHDLESFGTDNSYVWLGPNWGVVSSGPLRDQKGSTFEGGIRVPAIVAYASGELAMSTTREFITIRDVLPTILDVVTEDGGSPLIPDADHYRPDGKSLMPYLRGDAGSVHGANYVAAWELSGRCAVRRGDWKLVRDGKPPDKGNWSLYNLNDDPWEQNDISEVRPDIFEELILHWEAYRESNGVYVVDGF